MIINSEFINETVNNFYDSFKNEENWCSVSGLNPNIDIYGNHKYQKLYALKYIPAYYFEYCILANKLNGRIKNKNHKIKVISMGCGLCPDYYALVHNLECEFEYHGYDAYEWSMRKFMPQVANDYNFYKKSLKNIKSEEIYDCDVFIFPKSIGDINDSNDKIIEHLANIISKINKNRIFFLNSYVSNENQNTSHVELFEQIHNKLLNSGFSTKDDYKKTFYKGDRVGQGLKGIHIDFDYDSGCFISCVDKNTSCTYCNVVKYPILTNKFMDYQLLEYFR